MRKTIVTLFSRFSFQYAPRRIYSIATYPTPAKSDIQLLPKHSTALDWVNAHKENIVYIAQWRANLFFLLLIAYYQQQRSAQISSTKLQYGSGVSPHIEASHASLFPSLIDCDVHSSKFIYPQSSIIDHSFLMHWNNMTVACPVISNRFDSYLEGRASGSIFRQQGLFLINNCAIGIQDPLVYMFYFFNLMKLAFNSEKIFVDKFELQNEKKAAKKVIEFQKIGLFQFTTSDLTLQPYYFEKILLWDKKTQSRKTAILRTGELLRTGGKDDAAEFLKRFQF